MKPCPFCGSNDIRWSAHTGWGHRFHCMGCHAVGPPGGIEQGDNAKATTALRNEAATRLWNRRAGDNDDKGTT